MADRQHIDLSFLETFTGGNKEKMAKYIGIFLQLCPGQLDTMKKHQEAGDYNGLRATAHALKPQITYMGIKAGEDLIKRIEKHAGEKFEVEKLPSMLDEFSSLCGKAIEELRAAV